MMDLHEIKNEEIGVFRKFKIALTNNELHCLRHHSIEIPPITNDIRIEVFQVIGQ